MKRFLLIAIALLFCIPSASSQEVVTALRNKPSGGTNTFTFIQQAHATAATCGTSTTCSVTISATTSNATGIIWIPYGNGTSISVTSVKLHTTGTSFTVPPSCATFDSDGEGIAGLYLNNETAGNTQIDVVMASAPGVWAIKYQEVSATTAPTFDNCKVDISTGSGGGITCTAATCHGPTATLSGTNDALSQAILAGNGDITAVASPYSTHQDFTDGIGAAIAVNTTSQPAAWTAGSTEPGEAGGVMGFK